MNPSPFLIRWLPSLGVCAFLCCATAAAAQGQAPPEGPLGECKKSFSVRSTGEQSLGRTGKLTGEVRIECDGTEVYAEEVSWTEQKVFASGDLLVIQDGLRITADRMEMDRKTKLGTFFVAHGTAKLTDAPVEKSLFGTMEAEVWFDAERIERLGPRSYKMTNGWFSTCVQPNPRWVMGSSSATIVLDEHVIMKNVVFRVKKVPLLYLPYLYYPLKEEDRSTGFLIPVYTASGVRGQGINTAFFVAINRSQDATLFYDYFSKAGQGVAGEYRYVAAAGSQGDARLKVLFEKERLAPDGSVERAAQRSFDLRASINQAMGRRFRLIGRVDYFSNASTQQLYQQNVYDLSQSQRYVGLTLQGYVGPVRRPVRISAVVDRRDVLTDLTTSQQSGRTPQVRASLGDSPIGRSPVYFGAAGEVAYLDTRVQAAVPVPDRSLWRMDGMGTVRAPLSRLSFLSLTTSASWRLTRWLESLDPLTGLPVPVPLTRNLIDLRADLVGPVFAGVFQTPENGYAERFKHLIEPRVSVQWLSPFDRLNEVILTDQVDRQVGGTTSVTYALGNRVLARRRTADGSGRVVEFMSVNVGQSYYTNPLAAAYDPQYPTVSGGTLSPIQVSATITPTDELSGRFLMYIDSTAYAVRSYSASTSMRVPRLELTAGWSKRQYLPTVPGFDNPTTASHFINASASVRTIDDRVGATYGFNFDVGNRRLMQQRIVAYLNSQCCGFAVDYQVTNVSQFQLSGVPLDRRLSVTFTLAGIGSFSPPLGGFTR